MIKLDLKKLGCTSSISSDSLENIIKDLKGLGLLSNILGLNSVEVQVYLENIILELLPTETDPSFIKGVSLEEFDLNLKGLLFKGLSLKIKMVDGFIIEKKLYLSLKKWNNLSLDDLYDLLNTLLENFNNLNKRGFMIKTSFNELPFINELAPLFIKGGLDDPSIVPLYYKNLLNFFLINVVNLIEGLKKDDTDIYSDLTNLSVKSLTSLDPYIRTKMLKRGISLIQNVYTGFDTEYESIDFKHNKLLSVQIAVTTRNVLKIPSINPNTRVLDNEIPKDEKGLFNTILYSNSINSSIKEYRSGKYSRYDKSLDILIKGLKSMSITSNIKHKLVNEDHYFMFPLRPIKTGIYLGNKFSSVNLINETDKLIKDDLSVDYKNIFNMLKDIYKDTHFSQILRSLVLEDHSTEETILIEKLEDCGEKGLTKIPARSRMSSFTDDIININRTQRYYLIAHLTSADLSMLGDFEEIKNQLDIVNSNFVTVGKPILLNGKRVFIRDTMLLTPAGNRSLDSMGRLYNMNKIDLKGYDKSKMGVLLKENKELFIEYAVRDSVITLMHACFIEEFRFEKTGKIGVPVTLSSLGTEYVISKWDEKGYKGYNQDQRLNDVSVLMTPKGLTGILKIGSVIPYYIASYKGGRNECYMYGVDDTTRWFDYDLVSAYTTVMSVVGEPDYKNTKELKGDQLKNMADSELINSFTVISGKFEFPKLVKYPSIPVKLNEDITVYPLKGDCVITGIEYVLARNQGCKFQNIKVINTPFGKEYPFKDIIKEVQHMRRQYPSGSILNMLYKEMGNSIYGNTVRGISNKRKFDIKSGHLLRMEPGKLSNPLIAGWITSYIRSILGECLHNIQEMKGNVVSCTTDGFITDIENLEDKIIQLPDRNKFLLNCYRMLRKDLSGNDTSLELKHEGIGITSWSTRGHFSLNSKIIATTGFQRQGYQPEFLDSLFKNTLSKPTKNIEFVQSRLRSSLDIYKKGGHVTKVYTDRAFKLLFDNKRVIDLPESLRDKIDYSDLLLDSKPGVDVKELSYLRDMSTLTIKKVFDKRLPRTTTNKYKDYTDLVIRNFLKALLNGGLENDGLNFDNYESIIDFIKGYKKSIRISKQSLSNLKNRPIVLKSVPYNEETKNFINYVKTKFPHFKPGKVFNI